MANIGLSAFSLFFMASPSFLAHQRALARGQGGSNCQTLFGMAAIPSDNDIRLMPDGASPAAFDPLFMRAIEQAGPLTRLQCLGGRGAHCARWQRVFLLAQDQVSADPGDQFPQSDPDHAGGRRP